MSGGRRLRIDIDVYEKSDTVRTRLKHARSTLFVRRGHEIGTVIDPQTREETWQQTAIVGISFHKPSRGQHLPSTAKCDVPSTLQTLIEVTQRAELSNCVHRRDRERLSNSDMVSQMVGLTFNSKHSENSICAQCPLSS